MAPPPRYMPQGEDEPTEWMQGRRGVTAPWKFFANLKVGDAPSMRLIAEYLNYCFTFDRVPPWYAVGGISERMNWVERYEAQRMMAETRRWTAEGETNQLLYELLAWFGRSFQGSDYEVLTRANMVHEFVTIFVREPELYTVEHEEARAEWEKYKRQNQYEFPLPEESDSDESEEQGNTSAEYDEEGDPMDEDPAQRSEAEDQCPEEDSVETSEQLSNAVYSSESFASLGYVAANDQTGFKFDDALVSRLNFLNSGIKNNDTANVSENCALGDITNRHHMGSSRSGGDNFHNNGIEKKVLVEEDISNESIDEEDNESNVVQESARNFVFEGNAGRLKEMTTIDKDEHNDYNTLESPQSVNSEAETIIANPRRRRKRESLGDSSEADDSDGSSSSDAPSINVFLDTVLPKEGRTTRSGRGYNPYTGDMGSDPSFFGTPLRTVSNPTSSQSPVRRGHGRGGRPRGRGRGRGRVARSASILSD